MDPRDDDIEFDFFEEESPTAEGPGRGGARGFRAAAAAEAAREARRTPRAGLAPLLRLLAFIAIVIAVLVVFGLMLQSCSSTSKHDAYQSYLAKVATIAHSSTQDGVSVATVLTTPGLKATDLYSKLSSIAEQERQNATNAAALNPPGRLRDENQQVVEALQLRVSGTQGLADTFKATAASTAASDADLLVSQADRLLASDVVWDDLFFAPTKLELQTEGVSGVQVPESHFVANTDLITATSMAGRPEAAPRRVHRRHAERPARHEHREDGRRARRQGALGVDVQHGHRQHRHRLPRHGARRRRLAGGEHQRDADHPEGRRAAAARSRRRRRSR